MEYEALSRDTVNLDLKSCISVRLAEPHVTPLSRDPAHPEKLLLFSSCMQYHCVIDKVLFIREM